MPEYVQTGTCKYPTCLFCLIFIKLSWDHLQDQPWTWSYIPCLRRGQELGSIQNGNIGLYITGRLTRNQIRFCHFKTFLHPPSPPSISCLQHVYWGIACKPYHNPRLNINYILSGHWQITGISGCAFVLACTQIKSACKVTIIKVSQREGEESWGIITGESGYLSSQGSHWEEPACMPFTPQKKDRGKPGFWPKPSRRAPQAVPNPAFSLHLVKHPVTSTAATSSPRCRTMFYASSLTVGCECFYGRGQRPRWTLGFLLWETLALTVSATAAFTFAMRAHLQCSAASATASSPIPWHSQHPMGWPQSPPCCPGWAWAAALLSLLEAASKPSCSHPEPGCGLLGKGKNLWQFFSVFLPWRAMRLTDISKCLFPECCDKTKPALTGTCSLFPLWSLICHCWRLEDLNGSETDTSLGLLPNARSNLYVSSVFSLPAEFTEG